MLNAKRQGRIEQIMRIAGEQGNASTIYLAKSLGVSESSIRRDINYIVSSERFRNVKRVYGGMLLEEDAAGRELMFELKLALNHELKASIAAAAARFIEDGDHIIIDSGTTCLCLAERLHDKGQLQVITLDIKIAEELGKHSNIESNIIGGVVMVGVMYWFIYLSKAGRAAAEQPGAATQPAARIAAATARPEGMQPIFFVSREPAPALRKTTDDGKSPSDEPMKTVHPGN